MAAMTNKVSCRLGQCSLHVGLPCAGLQAEGQAADRRAFRAPFFMDADV